MRSTDQILLLKLKTNRLCELDKTEKTFFQLFKFLPHLKEFMIFLTTVQGN